jgi:two-component system, OmpR family, response regulator
MIMTVDRKTILIAEDEEKINRLISALFRNKGFLVFQAYSGKEALNIVFKEKIDLALLNLMMPYPDGGQVLRRTRAAGMKLPVIIFSVRNREADLQRCLMLGANDYLVKPFELNDMASRVNKLIAGS